MIDNLAAFDADCEVRHANHPGRWDHRDFRDASPQPLARTIMAAASTFPAPVLRALGLGEGRARHPAVGSGLQYVYQTLVGRVFNTKLDWIRSASAAASRSTT